MIFRFLMTNILSFSIIFLGILMIIFRKKPINRFIGFFSQLSSINQETWCFGNLVAGKFCICYGIALMIISLIMKIFISNWTVIYFIILIIFLFSFFFLKPYVNTKIKKKFKI